MSDILLYLTQLETSLGEAMRLATKIRTQLVSAPLLIRARVVPEWIMQNAPTGSNVPVLPGVFVYYIGEIGVVGHPVTFVITEGAGSGTVLSGVTDANGVFRIGSWTLGSSTGNNKMVAHVLGAADDDLLEFDVVGTTTAVGVDSIVAQTGIGQTNIPAGTIAPIDPVFRVTDQPAGAGAGVEGAQVQFVVTLGNGSVVNLTGTTDENGDVSPGDWTTGGTVAVNEITAQVMKSDGVTQLSASIQTTTVVGAAAKLLVIQAPSPTGTSGQALAIQPIFQAADVFDNYVVDIGNIVATVQSGTLVLSAGGTVALDGSGRGTYTALALTPVSGSGVVRYARGGYYVEFPLTLAPPTPTQVRFVLEPTGAVAGQSFSWSAEVCDVNGTRITGDNSTVISLALTDNTEGAAITGSNATCVAGLASRQSSVNLAGIYRAVVDAGALADDTSAVFVISVPGSDYAPAGLTVLSGIGDLSGETIGATIVAGSVHAGFKAGTGSQNMKVRSHTNQAWRPVEATAILAPPDGLDKYFVVQWGGTTSIQRGEKGELTLVLPSGTKSFFFEYSQFLASNFWGVPTAVKTDYAILSGGGGSKSYGEIIGNGGGQTQMGCLVNSDYASPQNIAIDSHPRGIWVKKGVHRVIASSALGNDGQVVYWKNGVLTYRKDDVIWKNQNGTGNTSWKNIDLLCYWGTGNTSDNAVPANRGQFFIASIIHRVWWSTSRILAP